MKRRIDLEKAAEAEVVGALAACTGHKHHTVGAAGRTFTPAQGRAFSDLVRSLVQVAKGAGAEQRRVTVGGVSVELRDDGFEEILSIRTAAGS